MKSPTLRAFLLLGLGLMSIAAGLYWYYRTTVQRFDRPFPPPSARAPVPPGPKFDTIDPADLFGTWESDVAAVKDNTRSNRIRFEADRIEWDIFIGVGDKQVLVATRYSYSVVGPVLNLEPVERTVNGEPIDPATFANRFETWAVKWKDNEKSGFSLSARAGDPPRADLQFIRAKP